MISNSPLAEHYGAICRDLKHLCTLLHNLPCHHAQVATIAPILKGLESQPITHIDVSPCTGHDAQTLAAACYQDLYIKTHYSQKCARRSVGVLWFSPSSSEAIGQITALVERINLAKAAIEAFIVATYATRQARFDALRAECPGVMTLHLYRQIRCYSEGSVRSVRFTWQRKDSLKKPVKAQLLERLQSEQRQAKADYQLPLQQLIDKVAATPESALRERRSVRVQPVANIMIDEQLKTVTAPMPIMIIQKTAPKIKMLRDFDASQQRKTRADKVASHVLGTFSGIRIEAFDQPA